MVAFLGAAQAAYDGQVTATVNAGPFMPLFVQDPADAVDGVVGWSWDGGLADPNTGWGQFQYRAFAQLAQYFYLSGDPEAGPILHRFRRWMAAHSAVDGSGRLTGLPITMLPGTEDVQIGYRAGDFALAAQGLLYLGVRTGSAPDRAAARALLDTLVARQDGAGAFPTDGARYGYEQAEAGIALALYDLLPGGDRPDPFRAALRGNGCQELVRRGIYLPQVVVR
jgi:hypothetical protein